MAPEFQRPLTSTRPSHLERHTVIRSLQYSTGWRAGHRTKPSPLCHHLPIDNPPVSIGERSSAGFAASPVARRDLRLPRRLRFCFRSGIGKRAMFSGLANASTGSCVKRCGKARAQIVPCAREFSEEPVASRRSLVIKPHRINQLGVLRVHIRALWLRAFKRDKLDWNLHRFEAVSVNKVNASNDLRAQIE